LEVKDIITECDKIAVKRKETDTEAKKKLKKRTDKKKEEEES
jgi:hypothetical protein